MQVALLRRSGGCLLSLSLLLLVNSGVPGVVALPHPSGAVRTGSAHLNAASTVPRSGPDLGSASPTTGFRLPLTPPAAVLTAFRPPASRFGTGHRGVDLAALVGTRVLAAAAGTVAFAGRIAGRGVVSVDHPAGIRTTYEPVTSTLRAGQSVVAGQLVGTLESGHPTCAPASCLHWGARLPDGSYLDPMSLITGLHVRLFPW